VICAYASCPLCRVFPLEEAGKRKTLWKRMPMRQGGGGRHLIGYPDPVSSTREKEKKEDVAP
jgi:hypothetical protein